MIPDQPKSVKFHSEQLGGITIIQESDSDHDNNDSGSTHSVTSSKAENIEKNRNNAYQNKAKSSNTLHRRLSAVSSTQNPIPNGSSLEMGSLAPLKYSACPPPIPESLPTTPGYELNANSYFDEQQNESMVIYPPQQLFSSESHELLQSTKDEKLNAESNTKVGFTSSEVEDLLANGMTLETFPRNKFRLIAVIVFIFTDGISDAAPGALLPRIEEYYHINYSLVSLIWLANAVGYISIALTSHTLHHFMSKRVMMVVGCICLVIQFALVSIGTVFPVTACAFFFGGVGLAITISQHNIFLSRFSKASTYLGYYHGSYGLGACVGPLIATSIVDRGIKWHYFYFILLGLNIINVIYIWIAFSGYDEDIEPWENHNEPTPQTTENPNPEIPVDSRPRDEMEMTLIGDDLTYTEDLRTVNTDFRSIAGGAMNDVNVVEIIEPVVPKGLFQLSLKNVKTWLLSFFVLFYQGGEVSLGGWIVTFLESYRHGNKSSTGYVASGFWGGLTIGRLFLTARIHKYVGAKRGVFVAALLAILFVLLSWLIPNVIASAVFVSLGGIFIGPIYPLMITVAVRVLPRKIQSVSLTIMTAFGSSGGALFPFLVGLTSQYCGTYVIMPYFIGLFCGVEMLWFSLPNPDRSYIKHFWERVW